MTTVLTSHTFNNSVLDLHWFCKTLATDLLQFSFYVNAIFTCIVCYLKMCADIIFSWQDGFVCSSVMVVN